MSRQHYRSDNYRARDSIGYLMKRVSSLMLDGIEAAFEEHGFTFTQWVVLMYVRDGIALTSADICREMRHDSGALTRVIDQLEERGLLARQRSREDRRVVELQLTRAGRETVESLIPITVRCLNAALDIFTRDEVATLKDLLTRMHSHLQDAAGTPAGRSRG